MVDAIQSALQGLTTQKTRINEAARDIASYPAAAKEKAAELEGVSVNRSSNFDESIPSLDESIITVLEASSLYKANASVIRTVNETEDVLLDILS